jgi:diphosphomevalonate decarboxylase
MGYKVVNVVLKQDVVKKILPAKHFSASQSMGQAFAPTNIALCKYWGKRNSELNLPVTSSLSISLGEKGANTTIQEIDRECDEIYLNGNVVDLTSAFGKRLCQFLDLFRPDQVHYRVDSKINIPVAAGLASSACGFAALILALDQLYQWRLEPTQLSILARLGSGSAARSIWHGFVEWHAGETADGMDSCGECLKTEWPDFRMGLHLLSSQQKPLSSREAMLRTVNTSKLYSAWPLQVKEDLQKIKNAIAKKDFELLGSTAETNALSMHATMLSAWPPVLYSLPETIKAMHDVWKLRAQGIPVYFTQDAGPNLKLLFLNSLTAQIQLAFPNIEICTPFK